MSVDLFAGVAVSDLDRALDWYGRLFGAAPAFFPNDVEAVWEVAEDRHVYVKLEPDHAGHAMLTLFVDDLDARAAAMGARGIEPAVSETYDNGVRKVIYRDPDGNEIGFAGGPAA
jgi:catechol 2,3-dioxygenase-like lactoylglutathione lyase family enzyme